MLRILLATFGSLGDLFPYIALGVELKRLGLSVTIGTDIVHKNMVVREGLDFHAVRPDVIKLVDEDPEFMKKVMRLATGSEFVIRQVFMRHLQESWEDFWEASADADLIVSHTLTFAAVLAAEKRGIPWISTALAPMSLLSAHDLPTMPNALWTSRLTNITLAIFMRNLMKRHTLPWFKPLMRLRAELGLPPAEEHPLFEGNYSKLSTLAMFSKVLAQPQPDWPPNTVITGFPFYDGLECSEENMTRLDIFVNSGPPPIVFTLGSSAIWDAGRFFHDGVDAAASIGARAVLLTGPGNYEALKNEFADRPGVAVFDALPHASVFPRALINVHQGGIGTTGQALRAGVPQLIIPFSHDQPDNARRVAKLGAGRFIPRSSATRGAMIGALHSLVSTERYKQKAQAVAEIVRTEAGAKIAAQSIVEQLNQSHRQ